jgi:ATP-dependent Clp protease ATP-binding subunit ClpA
LRRAIQKNVESPLSVELLSGKYKEGATILVDADEENNKIIFHASEPLKKKTRQHAEA